MKGKHHTKEAKEKNRIAHIGKPSPRKGIHLSKEGKEKLSEIHKSIGDHPPEEFWFKEGHAPWNKDLPKDKNPLTGKKRPDGVIEKMRGRKVSIEGRERMSNAAEKRQKELWANEDYRKMMLPRLREGIKKVQQNEEAQRKRFKSLVKKPNAPEQIIIDIIAKHNLPYKYTGNGDFILGGKCPDFINTNGKKEVIEVFGRVFHSPLFTFRKNMPYHQTYEGTIAHYNKYGFKCRIFWDTDVTRADAEQFILTQLGV